MMIETRLMRLAILRLRTRARSAVAAAAVALLLMASPAHAAWQPPVPAAQDGFVPVDESKPQEQLPAAPLVMAAYAFAWAAILFYIWSIWARLGRVEREMAEVGRRIDAGVRPGAR